ncbi:MAG TPA: hypothetical protein VGV38_16330, partial [Pyrinomonadaceae bacterium]|nr:hypothetical protein [Pyrinomonadaceae bacterium]
EGTSSAAVLSCPHFELEVLNVDGAAFACDTRGRSFHLLTLTDGAAELRCDGESLRLGRYETALVAGGAGLYELRARGGPARILRATVPTTGG